MPTSFPALETKDLQPSKNIGGFMCTNVNFIKLVMSFMGVPYCYTLFKLPDKLQFEQKQTLCHSERSDSEVEESKNRCFDSLHSLNMTFG